MANKYLLLGESEEKEFSAKNFLSCEYGCGSDETKRIRMKKLIRAGIQHELTQRQNDCIRLKYIDGLTAEEIACELEISPATVYKHIRKGIKKLKKLTYYI